MSYSMLEPEEDPYCECFYVKELDAMNRENCLLHCDLDEDHPGGEVQNFSERRRPETVAEARKADAA